MLQATLLHLTLLLCLLSVISAVDITTCSTGAKCVRIAFTYAGTGGLALEGNQMKQGYELWAKQANEGGGIKTANGNYEINLIGIDDASNATFAAEQYKAFIMSNATDFLLGPYATSINEAVAAETSTLNHVLVISNAATESLYNNRFADIFGVVTTTQHYSESFVKVAQANGARHASIYHSTVGFTQSVATGTQNWLTANNMQILGTVDSYTPPEAEAQIPELIKKAKELNPDILFSVGLFADGEDAAKALASLEYSPKAVWMTSAASNHEFVSDLGVLANCICGTAQWHPEVDYAGIFFANSAEFVKEYKEEFNDDPSFISASAAAAGIALSEGISAATDFSQASLSTSMKALNITTFYGPIAFNSNGRNILKPMVTTQIINGIIEIVAPEEERTKPLVYPMSAACGLQVNQSSNAISYEWVFVALIVALVHVMLLNH